MGGDDGDCANCGMSGRRGIGVLTHIKMRMIAKSEQTKERLMLMKRNVYDEEEEIRNVVAIR